MKFLLPTLTLAVISFAPLPGLLLAQESPAQAVAKDENLTDYDRKFVREAAEDGLAEVAFGKLAAEKGGTEAVRELGKQIAADHEKVNAELQALATKLKIKTPKELEGDEAKDYKKLSKLSGAAFDQEFVEETIDDHVDSIEDFEDATMKLTNPELKEFAKKTIPALQAHLQKAREVKRGLTKAEKPTE